MGNENDSLQSYRMTCSETSETGTGRASPVQVPKVSPSPCRAPRGKVSSRAQACFYRRVDVSPHGCIYYLYLLFLNANHSTFSHFFLFSVRHMILIGVPLLRSPQAIRRYHPKLFEKFLKLQKTSETNVANTNELINAYILFI